MGTNQSWLSLRVAPRAHSRAVAAVVASWEARGARLVSRAWEPLEERTDPPKKGRLGVQIEPAGRGLFTVCDSTRYLSDAALARDLAAHLDATVLRLVIADAAGYLGVERFGPIAAPELALTPPSRWNERDEHRPKAIHLVFEGLKAGRYEPAAPPSLVVRCRACGAKRWSPGYDVPFVPEQNMLVPMRGKSVPASSKLLVALRCNSCEAALGWAEVDRVEGLIVAVRPLAACPKSRDGLDGFLERQRALVEAALPSRAMQAADARGARFEDAFREAPRTALERALDAIRPALRKTDPELVRWVFAETRDALWAEACASAPAFTWRPVDLPGKVATQLVAWVGPKPSARAVAAFFAQIGSKLGEGAFARQGRHPETRDWILLVGFALPDGSWAGLRLFDQLRRDG